MMIDLMVEEIGDVLPVASDDEKNVSESEDHTSEASKLSSDDDKPEDNFTNSSYMSKDKSVQYRSELPLQATCLS